MIVELRSVQSKRRRQAKWKSHRLEGPHFEPNRLNSGGSTSHITPGPTWKRHAKAEAERGQGQVGRPPRSADATLGALAPNRLEELPTDIQSPSQPVITRGG